MDIDIAIREDGINASRQGHIEQDMGDQMSSHLDIMSSHRVRHPVYLSTEQPICGMRKCAADTSNTPAEHMSGCEP